MDRFPFNAQKLNTYLKFPVTWIAGVKFPHELKQSFSVAFLEICKFIILLFVDQRNCFFISVTILRERFSKI